METKSIIRYTSFYSVATGIASLPLYLFFYVFLFVGILGISSFVVASINELTSESVDVSKIWMQLIVSIAAFAAMTVSCTLALLIAQAKRSIITQGIAAVVSVGLFGSIWLWPIEPDSVWNRILVLPRLAGMMLAIPTAAYAIFGILDAYYVASFQGAPLLSGAVAQTTRLGRYKYSSWRFLVRMAIALMVSYVRLLAFALVIMSAFALVMAVVFYAPTYFGVSWEDSLFLPILPALGLDGLGELRSFAPIMILLACTPIVLHGAFVAAFGSGLQRLISPLLGIGVSFVLVQLSWLASPLERPETQQVNILVFTLVGSFLYWGWAARGLLFSPLLAAIAELRLTGRRSAQELLRNSKQPPVLYLRSFSDDERQLPASNRLFLMFLGRPDARLRIEESIADVFFSVGPVVALSNPGSQLQPLGAAREEVSDDNWQGRISEHIAQSRIIVLLLGDTKNVRWEVQEILQAGALKKTVIFLPPGYPDELTISSMSRELAVACGFESAEAERKLMRNVRMISFLGRKPLSIRGGLSELTYVVAGRIALAQTSSA